MDIDALKEIARKTIHDTTLPNSLKLETGDKQDYMNRLSENLFKNLSPLFTEIESKAVETYCQEEQERLRRLGESA